MSDPLRNFLAPRKWSSAYLERVSILEALRRLRGEVQPGRMLDVGCGIKPYATLLTPANSVYWGVDYPVTMAGSYRDATRADVFANCQRLPFADGVFDTVVNTQVLEHVPAPGPFIAEMARVLRSGGSLILSAPMTWPLHEEPYDFYRYTIHGLRQLLREVGFEVTAEVARGRAASTLGQMFLDLHVARHNAGSLAARLYAKGIALAVNQACVWLDKLRPCPRLCLGWAIAARKRGQ